jgi:hypothetical protein
MIRKLKSGEYQLYSRKKNPKTGKRRNLGTFSTRAKAEAHERFEGLRGLLKEAFHSLGGGESFLRERSEFRQGRRKRYNTRQWRGCNGNDNAISGSG